MNQIPQNSENNREIKDHKRHSLGFAYCIIETPSFKKQSASAHDLHFLAEVK